MTSLFDKLKVFRIDLSDNHIIKTSLLTQNGCLELNYDSLELELYSNESSNRLVFLTCQLDKLDLGLIQNETSRIELKKCDKSLKFSYSIEFFDDFKRNEFKELVKNLDEAYMLSHTTDIEMKEDEPMSVNELIKSLSEAIRNGNLDESSSRAKDLARLKCNLEIKIVQEEVDKIEDVMIELSRVKVMLHLAKNNEPKKFELFLPTNEFTILDLKKQISAGHKLNTNDQIVIINDFNTTDAFLIEAYRVNRPTTSSQADNSNDFNVIVYLKSLNEDIETLVEAKQDGEIDEKNTEDIYNELAAFYNKEINENIEPFDCDICLEKNLGKFKGVILKECLHVFCKDCLKDYINHSDEPTVKCPFNKDYICGYSLQDREIRALISPEDYSKFQMKSLRISEAAMENTVHCKTPDCIGFCVSEDNLNFFDCPVCEKVNCLRCNVIHMGQTCKEYQDDLEIKAANDKNAQKDKEALEKLIADRKAMYCPGCKIILCKQEGCDWLQCAMCKMEICWATRGPRWGPGGHGDTSGGCKCNFAGGRPCHPKCGNCH